MPCMLCIYGLTLIHSSPVVDNCRLQPQAIPLFPCFLPWNILRQCRSWFWLSSVYSKENRTIPLVDSSVAALVSLGSKWRWKPSPPLPSASPCHSQFSACCTYFSTYHSVHNPISHSPPLLSSPLARTQLNPPFYRSTTVLHLPKSTDEYPTILRELRERPRRSDGVFGGGGTARCVPRAGVGETPKMCVRIRWHRRQE